MAKVIVLCQMQWLTTEINGTTAHQNWQQTNTNHPTIAVERLENSNNKEKLILIIYFFSTWNLDQGPHLPFRLFELQHL